VRADPAARLVRAIIPCGLRESFRRPPVPRIRRPFDSGLFSHQE